jgi:hypothetical protein
LVRRAVGIRLGGCATKYQEMGFAGGVAAEPVMTDVYRIVANAYGGDYFAML